MDADRFDDLARTLPAAGSRRMLLRLGLGSMAGALLADAEARKKKGKCKKKKGKQKRKCQNKGKGCTPTSCPQGQLCHAGACHACDVVCHVGTCTMAGLQAAIDAAGETLYICPGRYTGQLTFNPAAPVTLIGAGDGADPKISTILDGQGTTRVVAIDVAAAAVTLQDLRITGGRATIGGGILHDGAKLTMSDCTVTGNTADTFGGGGIHIYPDAMLEMTRCTVSDNRGIYGAGIFVQSGTVTLTDCLIEGNSAGQYGGGIYTGGVHTRLAGSTVVRGNAAGAGGGIYVDGGEVEIAPTCRVTDNTATGGVGYGGGIYLNGGTVTLQGADPSPIVVANCVENCAGTVAVAKCAAGRSCPA
jgi:predicted outer membrane repeat protein